MIFACMRFMKKKLTLILALLTLLGFIALSVIFISTHNIPVLEPKGLIGEKQRNLIVLASYLMLIVVIPVFFLTLLFSFRYQEGHKKSKYTPDWEHSTLGEALWWGIPFVIITVLAVFTWISSYRLSPFKPLENAKAPLKIQVVALEWKWLFIYPEQGIAVVNDLRFPSNTPLEFEITADAPMNSFWIPQLGGQIYAMPSMRSQLHLIANEVGSYRGCTANLSGKGFASMYFQAQALTDNDFESWVREVKSGSSSLNKGSYYKLAQPSEYVPTTYYQLGDHHLFDSIIQKYLTPQNTPTQKEAS